MQDRPRTKRDCWCGNTRLQSFSPEYGLCPECGTLVSRVGLTDEELRVREDVQDYYGKEYWLSHMRDNRNFPTIEERARTDLPVRCTHWLRALLRFKLPPGRVLELGAAHGGFAALLGWAGFEATGLELSPWVVDFARKAFGVPMLQGPVEEQDLPAASFDAIVLNDVLEHLPDPEATMGHCARLLGPDGLLVIQTPQLPAEQDYSQLTASKAPFLEMMAPSVADEHLYLFSRRSLRVLLGRLGLGVCEFEVPAHPYDMYVFASRQPCPRNTAEQIATALARTPSGRLAQALIDAQADMQSKVDEGRVAFEDLQQQAQAALRDLARHIEEGQTALKGTLAGVAAMQREIDERHKEIAGAAKEIADATLVIDGLRLRLADRDDLGATAIRVARKLQNVARRFPRLNRLVRRLLPRSKAARSD